MSKSLQLMNLFWTSAGIMPGSGEISRFDFRSRVEAASKAGFSGIGIWHTDLEHITTSMPLREMKAILGDNGIVHVELEFLTDWFVDGARRRDSDARRKRLLAASEALHAKHIKVGDFYNVPCPLLRVVESFAALCREAEGHGATIGFEFMLSAMIDNMNDARRMVEIAGARNGGLILDIVHVVNDGFALEEVRRIPPQYLVNVELNDGTLPGSLGRDPSRARRFCGEGEFDTRGFIRCIQGMGYTGPWAVEVFSEELASLSLDEVNARAYRSTIAQFEGL